MEKEMPETKRKTQRGLAAGCLITAVLLLLFAPADAFAAVAAPDRIDIFDQYGLEEGRGDNGDPWDYKYGHAPFLLTDGRTDITGHVAKWNWYGKPNCLAQGGCCLFAHAHAIEWLEGRRLGDGILRQLLGVCVSPSNTYGHNYSGCHHTGKSYDAYTAYARTRGIAASVTNVSLGRDALRKGFCDGNVYVAALPDGSHYICAVDYVIADRDGFIVEDDGADPIPAGGAFYIQIVDSCPYASSQSGNRFAGKMYELDPEGRLVLHSGLYPMYYGACYFVKTDVLTIRSIMSKKSDWPGHLRKERTCKVSYDACGGILAPQAQAFPWGGEAEITEETPARFGYRFLGWAGSAGASEAEYAPGDSYTAYGDVTLYAVWSPLRVLNLPGGLRFAEPEAFSGTAAECVVCPDLLEAIGARAFAGDGGPLQILIPESVGSIDDTAFEGRGVVEIWGRAGSEAERFAAGRSGFVFYPIGGE